MLSLGSFLARDYRAQNLIGESRSVAAAGSRFRETENDGARHRSKGYYMHMADSKTVKFKVSLPKVRSVASSRRIKHAVRTVKESASSGRKK